MDDFFHFVSLVSQKSEENNLLLLWKEKTKHKYQTQKGILNAWNRQKKQSNKQKRTLKMYKKLQIKRGKQRLPPANHCRCSACASHLTLLNLPGHALFSSRLWMRKPRPGEVRWLFWHCWVTEDTAGIKPSRLTLEPGTLHNSTCDSREGKMQIKQEATLPPVRQLQDRNIILKDTEYWRF